MSEPFERLVNGNLIEAQERSAELPDVDPDTFQRFLEYAYRRDYKIRSYYQVSVDLERSEGELAVRSMYPEDMVINYTRGVNYSPQLISKLKPQNRLRFKFSSKTYDYGDQQPITYVHRNSIPRSTPCPDQDFTPIFLAHARLYTFANMHMMHEL